METKYTIRPNSVEETLIIPLFARLIAEERLPHLKGKRNTLEVVDSLDYDFASKRKKMSGVAGLYGALEVVQREYDLCYEVKRYLDNHPKAAVVNLGCGLLDLFVEIDNGECSCYNIDFPSVIEVRNHIMPPKEREKNLGYDLNDYLWMDQIQADNGVIFVASGVFYYFQRDAAIRLFKELSSRFPNSSLAFDTCNKKGLKMMLRTWIKEAGIKDVGTYFGLNDPIKELNAAGVPSQGISVKSYMHGYRKLKYRLVHKLFNVLMDKIVKARIVRIDF